MWCLYLVEAWEPRFTAFQWHTLSKCMLLVPVCVCVCLCVCVCVFRLPGPASCGECQPHWECSQFAPVQSPFPGVPDLWPADRPQEHCEDDILEPIWREDSFCKGLYFISIALRHHLHDMHSYITPKIWIENPNSECFLAFGIPNLDKVRLCRWDSWNSWKLNRNISK